MKNIISAAALICLGSAASAIPLSSGTTACEGPIYMDIASCDVVSRDYNNVARRGGTNLDLQFASGAAELNGFIRGGQEGRYSDAYTLSGQGMYRLTFELLGNVMGGNAFDADLFIGDALSAVLTDQNRTFSTVLSLDAADMLGIELRAGGGEVQDRSSIFYKTTYTSIASMAAVPLPASGLLLVGALGAMGLRRRKKAA